MAKEKYLKQVALLTSLTRLSLSQIGHTQGHSVLPIQTLGDAPKTIISIHGHIQLLLSKGKCGARGKGKLPANCRQLKWQV